MRMVLFGLIGLVFLSVVVSAQTTKIEAKPVMVEDSFSSVCVSDEFKQSCLVQTQKDPYQECNAKVVNNDFVVECEPISLVNLTRLKTSLSVLDSALVDIKGIRVDTNNYVYNNKTNITSKIYSYIPTNIKSVIPVKGDSIKIGYATNIFNITNLYYGYGTNISIDTDVELSPTDDDIILPREESLIGRWDKVCDGIDTSGNGYNGVVSGVYCEHERGNFNVGDYVTITNNTPFRFNNTFSIESWFMTRQPSRNYQGIVGYGYTNKGYQLWVSASKIAVNIGNGTHWIVNNAYNTLVANRWYHTVLTMNETNYVKLYLDGVEVGSVQAPTSMKSSMIGYALLIGASYAGQLNGSIENVRIWNTVLNSSAVGQIYNQTRFNTEGNSKNFTGTYTSGTFIKESNKYWQNYSYTTNEPERTNIQTRYRIGNATIPNCNGTIGCWLLNNNTLDGSGNNFNGTKYGGNYTGGLFYNDSALRFSGSDYVSIGTTFTINETTITSVFRTSYNSPTNQVFVSLGGRGGYTWGNKGVLMLDDLERGCFLVGFISGSYRYFCTASSLNNGNYHSLTAVSNMSGSFLYLDGELVNTYQYSLYNVTLTYNKNAYIGTVSGDFLSNYFHGDIDSIQIYNYTLNQAEIKSKWINWSGWSTYTNDKNIVIGSGNQSESGLQIDWKFDTINNSYTPVLENYSISLGILNNVPVVSNVILNSTTLQNYSNETLYLNFDVNDLDGDNISNITSWYRNGVLQNGLENLTSVSPVYTYANDVWFSCVTPYDSISYGVTVCSNNVTIIENPDIMNPMWKLNNTNISGSLLNQSVHFNITLYDDKGPGTYIFSWYNGTNWTNTTPTPWVNNTRISVNKILPSKASLLIQWYWYFSDINGKINQTPIWNYLIPQNFMNLTINDTGLEWIRLIWD